VTQENITLGAKVSLLQDELRNRESVCAELEAQLKNMKVKTGKCIIIHLCVPSYLDQCHGYAGILTSARVSSYPDQYHRYQRYQRYAGTLTSVRGMQVHWPVVMHKVVFTYILNL